TPATCANVALHNLYPNEIDLVISGPNFARNTSSAFALSSGTIGAALSAALSRKRTIALSYGTFIHPPPKTLHDPVHRLAIDIISKLWSNWGVDPIGIRGDGEVDLFNVNIPVVEKLLPEEGIGMTWSTMWRNTYGRLFKQQKLEKDEISAAGPDADTASESEDQQEVEGSLAVKSAPLVFKFSPEVQALVKLTLDSLPEGTVHSGLATVTPLRAAFAEPPADVIHSFAGETVQSTGVKHWKMKL
ncbi:hypothetical protein M422DRAFT_34443, partial [Sphaerobolus stellatus SS14]